MRLQASILVQLSTVLWEYGTSEVLEEFEELDELLKKTPLTKFRRPFLLSATIPPRV
eukprot:CAMPEP_0118669386 /NCGR_PEP_ID=MMETSP0785-20121206/20868_1 /TAXON_ID=91992 /ORGANISM="Bolidomonas pacifica, Strain CCMP 1866" /LENGTH=56 /DNA_ID=CAMNT_0006564055 /DNA_START=118 /DNA_END=288 /DNA_ORIENTATION=-